MAKHPEVVRELIKKAQEKKKEQRHGMEAANLSLRRRQEVLEKKIDQVTDQILESQTSADKQIWQNKLLALQMEQAQISKEQKSFEKHQNAVKDIEITEEKILDALSRFSNEFDSLPIASKQLFIQSLVNRIELDSTQVTVWLRSWEFEESDFVRQSPGQELAYPGKWLASLDDFRTSCMVFAA